MTLAGWKEAVREAARQHAAGDSSMLDLVAVVLHEHDDAKQALRDKGYGWTGLGLLKTVERVPKAKQ